ncbi:hypothetical protein DPMN_163789 [Dreissena polymorpha]|uniref:Uncharacterized protein n=1 Tax=Dreissena polymorpha TaxID=45954 RepID=A0A9D4ESH5_DREPO|nr:hypothetical protein DPMN_163789 [Dreissena polymorpha]
MATESVAYTSGFQACAREVITYLTPQKSADMKTIKALSDHLQATQPAPQKCVRNQMPGGYQMSTPVRINDVSKMSTYTLRIFLPSHTQVRFLKDITMSDLSQKAIQASRSQATRVYRTRVTRV